MEYSVLLNLVGENEILLNKLVKLEMDIMRQLTHKRDVELSSQIKRELYHFSFKIGRKDEVVFATILSECRRRLDDRSGRRYKGRMNEACPVCGAELDTFKRGRVYTYEQDKDRDVSYVIQTWNVGRELHARYRCCECDSVWEDTWERSTWSGNKKVVTYGHHGKVLVDGRLD